MKKFYTLPFICLLLLAFSTVKAQLTVDNTTLTPQQLVQNILIGQGVTVSNITYTGNALQFGSFSSNGSNVGLTNGVIMSSGYADVAEGPNDGTSTSNPLGGVSTTAFTDANLTSVAASTGNPFPSLRDVAILEFDFVPTSDSIKFRYVFGSDEYTEFSSNPTFNDVFGFFLTGVTVAYPTTNIARVPGTSLPVSILNISDVVNTQYYVANNTYPLGGTVEFDGFTVVLTAQAAVVCGETYHIKLAISDVGDGSYDSGVFLEAGSFSSVGTVQILPDVSYSTTNDTTMYEGCGDASIQFVRHTQNLSQPMTITYTLSGTATNGVDFANLPTQITIPAGDTITSLTINPIADGIPEGVETITFSVTNTVCTNSSTSTVTIYLNDVDPLMVDAGPDQSTACTNGSNIVLNPMIMGGAAPLNYLWDPTGETTSSISVLPANTTTYIINVTDFCGNTASDTVDVVVQPATPLVLTMSPDEAICQGESVLIEAQIQGGVGTVSINWSNGINTATQTVTPNVTSTYVVTVSDLCNQELTDSIQVDVSANNADFSWMFTDNNSLQFYNESVGYEAGIWWNFGDGNSSTAENPQHDYEEDGTYIVTLIVENAAGCRDTTQYSIVVQPEFYLYIPNAFTPGNDGINDSFNAKGVGFEVYTMRIYNRWGNLIYESSQLGDSAGWDGRGTNGKYVTNDVYIYEILVRIKEEQDPLMYRGKVVLMR